MYFFTLSSTLLHNAYVRSKLEAHRLSSITVKTWTTQNIMANQMDTLNPVISSDHCLVEQWRPFAEKQTEKAPFDQSVNTLDDMRGNSEAVMIL